MNNTLFWKSALVFALVLFGFSKWQTSQKVWEEYNDICSYSYGDSPSYKECMVFYDTQKEYFKKIDFIAYGTAAIAILFLLRSTIQKNKEAKVKIEKENLPEKKSSKKKSKKRARKS